MGYSTYFDGHFEMSQKLTVSQIDTLLELTRWDTDAPEDAPNDQSPWQPVEHKTKRVLEPGGKDLMCVLESINEEKIYRWADWLEFLIDKYFDPWGVKLNGDMIWQGEETGDSGVIFVKNNRVKFVPITEMPEPNWDEEEENGEATATA